ncbi:tyrosine-protein phosphatase [Thermodesulfobacteriota bacterium]
MIDIHCHILPGVDDGPSTLSESIAMAKQAAADGIQTVVATPHTLNEVYHNSAVDVNAHVDRLREALAKERIELDLRPGSDAHLCVEMAEKVLAGEVATIDNNGQYLLIEFPVQVMPVGFKGELFQLKLKGITPIITHPERNTVFQQKTELLYDLVNMGCLLQITAMSITGEFGEEPMKSARRMLELRLAHIIATDAHSPEIRPPILSPGVEAAARVLGNLTEAEEMVTIRPQAILEGKPVEIPEPKHPRKKWWRLGL